MEKEKSPDLKELWTTDLMPTGENGMLITAAEALPADRLSVTIEKETCREN